MILFLFIQKSNFIDILPMIVFYTFAGYRLMPALHQIYISVTQLRFVGPTLEALSKDLKILRPFYLEQDRDVLTINKGITLNHIHFNYPNTPQATLKDINLKIPSCSTVGLVGSSGSGKTTTVDIILGLLEAQKGTLEVDDKLIDQNNIRAWQRSIGYVPQNIYLTDDTVAANIAFGNLNEEINLEAVERAAKIADLHEFVINELPLKYQTTIGERGVRLSGGQRQRIGIARALYHNPKLLILDEATNALDTLTEQAVMDSIHKLKNKITIIMIAHRLSTIKECNIIFLLKKGELKAQGTFNELVNNCSEFDKLINSNKIT
jgi:ABC-type multidrug transport system fused ATPase/permease subunit